MRSAAINYAYLQSDGWRYESILKFNKHLIIIIMPITHHFFVHIYIVESLWMETETCIYEMQMISGTGESNSDSLIIYGDLSCDTQFNHTFWEILIS